MHSFSFEYVFILVCTNFELRAYNTLKISLLFTENTDLWK